MSKARFRLRRWLSSDPTIGSSVSVYIDGEKGDDWRFVDGSVTIRDCNRSVILYLDSRTDLKKIRNLIDALQSAERTLADILE